MATFDLKGLARRGAEARIAELQAELREIYRAFPELRKQNVAERFTRRGARALGDAKSARAASSRRRKPMTAAQRKAVGERMKKYWAERKAQPAAKK